MRVLLISGNREDVDIRVPALGLACIAAAVEAAGHEICLVDLLIERSAIGCCSDGREFQSRSHRRIGTEHRRPEDAESPVSA